MVAWSMNFIILLLLSINSILGALINNSAFTKEIRMNAGIPFKLGNELKLYTDNSIVSIESDHEVCRLTANFYPNWISNLGNGKLLMIQDTVKDFNIVNFKNCSSQVNTLISNGIRDYIRPLNPNFRLEALVTYNDSFDVFDHYQRTCMPCRYNDKGERLQVEHSLKMEPTGKNLRWAHQHDGYSLELIKDTFGVKNGYFYVFRYVNETSALKILDSNFKVVKQRLFNAKVEAHSVLEENITVCYKQDTCRRPYRGWCQSVKCHLLDSNLNTINEVDLHKMNIAPRDNKITVEMIVNNLVGGGAMIAMKFHFDRFEIVHHKDIFIQRIHPNGRVDDPIEFDSRDNEFTDIYAYTFDNGEYCLVTVNDEDDTLIKCLKPSSADYQQSATTT